VIPTVQVNSYASDYCVRLANADDAERINVIETEACSRFTETDLFEKLIDEERKIRTFDREHLRELIEKQQVWVACHCELPVGFAICSIFGDTAFVDEIDVMTAHGRRGLATALIQQACEWARKRGLVSMDLSTFIQIPWNAPFYTKLGFEVVPPEQWTEGIKAIRRAETDVGLPMESRVIMRLRLDR